MSSFTFSSKTNLFSPPSLALTGLLPCKVARRVTYIPRQSEDHIWISVLMHLVLLTMHCETSENYYASRSFIAHMHAFYSAPSCI